MRGEFRVCKVQNILHANFFMFMLLISNHTVSSFNLELICTCEFFKKRNCTRRSGSCNFSVLKNSLVQINSKLNSKPYDYLYLSIHKAKSYLRNVSNDLPCKLPPSLSATASKTKTQRKPNKLNQLLCIFPNAVLVLPFHEASIQFLHIS